MRTIGKLVPLLLTLAMPFCAQGQAADPAAAKQDLLKNKKDLGAIQRKLREEKKKQQRAQVQERNVLSRLQRVDQKLGTLRKEKQANRRDMVETRDRIWRLQVEMDQNQARLVQSRKALQQRLRALQRMSARRPFLGGLLDAGSFGEWSRRLRFELMLAETNQKLLARTLRHEEKLEKDNVLWTSEERRRNRIQAALEKQERNYSGERAKRTVFLASLRKEQDLRRQTIQDLSESAKDLQAKVASLLQQRKTVTKAVVAYEGPGLQVSRGRIPWPVSGTLISQFGKHRNKEFNAVVENSGIQIKAITGTPFRAVAAGLVRYADWFKGYGKLVILDHGEGYYSLYAQASDLEVSEGQSVTSGQVLGTVGDTGSLVGESLYFEIRKNGVPQDPVRWLKSRS